MKFFHVYNDECYEGLVKNGLINEDTGFKLQHLFSIPEERKFNKYAAKGSRLYNLIKEGKYPFYVDRIAGGATYHHYDFDKELIEEYKNLLGEWFLGFQLHESASNVRASDLTRLKKTYGHNGPYDAKTIREKIVSTYAKTPDGTYLPNLSHGTPEEYDGRMFPSGYQEFCTDIERMFKLRMEQTGGMVLPCDSYYLFTKLQDELGMTTFMPEVGWQIAGMRIAVAISRGIAGYQNKLWGVYYETWIATAAGNCSMPCYNTDKNNEWYLTQETHPDDFTTFDDKGGSSRYLQQRIYYYSLMSGADYIAEEWGLNCSYTDMTTFELSPYGKLKKEFITDALGVHGVKMERPFAIVLPKDYQCVQIFNPFENFVPGKHRIEYMRFPLSKSEQDYFGHIEDVLKFIFGRTDEIYGNEGHVMTNSAFGDWFDIIYEDAPEAILSKYEYLVDVTPDGSYAKKAGDKYKVIESSDFDKLLADIKTLVKEIFPVYVDSLHWLISTDDKGRRFVSIFNNEGNEREPVHGDTIDRAADRRVKITFKEAADAKIFKSGMIPASLTRVDEKTYYADIPATSFVILEY